MGDIPLMYKQTLEPCIIEIKPSSSEDTILRTIIQTIHQDVDVNIQQNTYAYKQYLLSNMTLEHGYKDLMNIASELFNAQRRHVQKCI